MLDALVRDLAAAPQEEELQLHAVGGDEAEPGVLQPYAVRHVQVAQVDELQVGGGAVRHHARHEADTGDLRATWGRAGGRGE